MSRENTFNGPTNAAEQCVSRSYSLHMDIAIEWAKAADVLLALKEGQRHGVKRSLGERCEKEVRDAEIAEAKAWNELLLVAGR